MRAALYLRQSKDAEATGLAVGRQQDDCEKLAADRGWDITATLTDNDLSASNGKARPGYNELVKLIDAKNIDVVVAWHVDRLTRRLSDLEDLIERCEATGVRVATVSGDLDLSTDAGRLVGRILGAVARGEIERKSARQRRAGLQAAEAGKPPTRRGFGFRDDGTHDPIEAPVLVELYRKVIAGLGVSAATRWLNEAGHTTTSGRPWERSGVARLIRNPRNAGLRTYNREVVGPGDWTPIVSEETYRAGVDAIDHGTHPNPSARRWLGSGLFYCHCGATVHSGYAKPGFRAYRCNDAHHLSRKADPIDQLVVETVLARLRQPDLADLLDTGDDGGEVAALRSEASDLRLRLDQVAEDYAEGMLTGRQLQIATGKVTDRLSEVEAALADAGRASKLGPVVGAPDPGQAFLDADLETQRNVIDTLMLVTILRGQRGRGAFDPDTVRIDWRGDDD